MAKRDTLKSISHGLGRRALKTGRIAASVASAGAKRAVRRSDEDDDAFGEALLQQMDEMKGLAMKVGQIVSYMDGVLPERTMEKLRALQQGATSLEWERIEPVLVEQLGMPVSEAFEALDTEPMAAASIGQVHRGQHDGQPVAVKVQYPYVRETFTSDLKLLRRFSRLAALGTAVDGPALADELKQRFLDECDYSREARWQTAFRDTLRVEGVHIPAVFTERSADKVLTTELSRGMPFYDFVEQADRDTRSRMAARLFEAAFTSIFAHGALNADPHPGNYLFELEQDDAPERLVLLDWGCVRPYSQDFISTWKRLARTMLDGDRTRFEEVFRATGMVGSRRFDFDVQWAQMEYLYEPFTVPGFRYDADYIARSYEFVDPRHNPNLRKLAMPPEWMWTQRLHWGLNSVLAHMDVDVDWMPLYRRILDKPWEPIRIEPLADASPTVD